MGHVDVPLLLERVGQKPMLFCPWCKEWFPKESFTALNMPPTHQDKLAVIYKHGGTGAPGGCKLLFALKEAS